MPKGKYSEEVTYEEIKYDAAHKKEVREKKLVAGSAVRVNKAEDPKDDIFYETRTVGNMGMRVEEGQFIVKFPDGREKLMTAEEFKENVTPMKEKKSDSDQVDDGAVVVLPLSDGTVQRLTQDQTKELVVPAAEAVVDKTAGSDEGKANPATKKGK